MSIYLNRVIRNLRGGMSPPENKEEPDPLRHGMLLSAGVHLLIITVYCIHSLLTACANRFFTCIDCGYIALKALCQCAVLHEY